MRAPVLMGGQRAAIIAHFEPGEQPELKVWRDREEFVLNENDPFLWIRFTTPEAIDGLTVVLSRMRNAMVKPKPGHMEVVDGQ